ALERGLVDGDRAPQRADRARLVRQLRLQVLCRHLLREELAEPAKPRDRSLRLLDGNTEREECLTVALVRGLVADRLRVAAERADDLRCLVRLLRELRAILPLHLERGGRMDEPVPRDDDRPASLQRKAPGERGARRLEIAVLPRIRLERIRKLPL